VIMYEPNGPGATNMNDDGNREFIERWKRVGPLLDEIRRKELRLFRHEDNWRIIDGLLEIGFQHSTRQTTSGLVELQKLLHRKKS
jgi:hypothetical protein